MTSQHPLSRLNAKHFNVVVNQVRQAEHQRHDNANAEQKSHGRRQTGNPGIPGHHRTNWQENQLMGQIDRIRNIAEKFKLLGFENAI